MTSKRMFFVMLGVMALVAGACVLVTVMGRKLIISEGGKLTELKLENEVLDKRETALLQAKNDIRSYEELELIARSVVPQDKDQARTALELVELGRQSGVNITSVQFPASLLGQVSTGRKPAGGTDPNLTQLTPLTQPKGVYAMTINIGIDTRQPIHYDRMVDFLKRLENNRRTAHVVSISVTPDTEFRNFVTFTLTLETYVKP